MNIKLGIFLVLATLASAARPNYNFRWTVRNGDSGNDFGHQEARDLDNTAGSYYAHLPDGRLQQVTYRVDGGSGYLADVIYKGEAGFPDSYESLESQEFHRPSYSFDSLESRERGVFISPKFHFSKPRSRTFFSAPKFSSSFRPSSTVFNRASVESLEFPFDSRESREHRFHSRESLEFPFNSKESGEHFLRFGSRGYHY